MDPSNIYIGKLLESIWTFITTRASRAREIARTIARALIRGTHAHLGRASVIMGAWFTGVEAPLGAGILSAVRNLEASASRRLRMYENYGNISP